MKPAPTQVRRRTFMQAGLAAGLAAGAPRALASPAALPMAESLPAELALALAKERPLLVMVSLEGCPFCKVVREHYLGPMHLQQSLMAVQVDMRGRQIVKDFDGGLLSHDHWVRARGVKIAPTVFFFGRDAAEVAPRLLGASLPDFFGAYLDERLAQAKAALRG